ncbi:MAG TPA: hypothetical protein VG838_01050 [Opitutaceae bacterium]|nr:hypothetical protein [Opitutaceae bacterium]
MKSLYPALWLLSVAPALAGISSATITLPAENPRPAPAVSIVQTADYLCATVVIRSVARDIDRQTAAVQETLATLRAGVEKSSRFQIHDGPLHLSGNAGALAGKSSFSNAVLQTTVRILCPLVNGTSADVFTNTRLLRQFIASFEPSNGSELQVVSVNLAVDTPEQYRDRLLELIGEQAHNTQRTFNARSVAIEGLNNAITVRQLDDINVELYIDYQLNAVVERQ